ncbi:MAG: hypothetical protein AMXMBFR33_50750 [Candidatus Xenobia bacterium]|jgi:hypothetical protein
MTYRHNPHTAWHAIGRRVVLVPLERRDGVHNNTLVLSGSAPALWLLLQEPRSAEELVAHLQSEYEVDRERAGQDVERFLERLLEWKALDSR